MTEIDTHVPIFHFPIMFEKNQIKFFIDTKILTYDLWPIFYYVNQTVNLQILE